MMQPMVIRITAETKRELEYLARQKNTTVASVARNALKQYLKKKPKKPNAGAVLMEWAKKSKHYKNRHQDTDVSSNYKKYLYK